MGIVGERTLVLGTSPLAAELVHALRDHGADSDIVGVVSERGRKNGHAFPAPVLGQMEELPQILRRTAPKRIIVAMAECRGHVPVRQLTVARFCRGVAVEDGEDAYERLTGKIAMESLTASRLLFSGAFQPACSALIAARVLSVLVAAAGLVVLAPLLALIAAAIKLDSPGPVLFVQERVGRRERPFRLLKFRTMHAKQGVHSEWARDNGDRVTRVGRWLRKYRLDELPQFINILRGEMNLVGPRPHPRSNHAMFALVSRNVPQWGDPIPYYSLRSIVRPGITGWAQVRYRYANDLSEEMEKMRYDLYYVKHLSLWLDLRILLETIRVVLFGHGSGAPGAEREAPRQAQRAGLR